MMSRLFGSRRPASDKAGLGSRPSPGRATPPERDASRRELLVMAFGETLRKHGIPPAWIGAETLAAITGGRERGMHLRLVLRHWEPRLLVHTMAVENSVRARIRVLDPLSSTWLAGISWRFEIADDAPCPPLPDAGYWQRLISNPPAPAVPDAQPKTPVPTARAVLERVFGSGDKARHDRVDFSPTQPMKDS